MSDDVWALCPCGDAACFFTMKREPTMSDDVWAAWDTLEEAESHIEGRLRLRYSNALRVIRDRLAAVEKERDTGSIMLTEIGRMVGGPKQWHAGTGGFAAYDVQRALDALRAQLDAVTRERNEYRRKFHDTLEVLTRRMETLADRDRALAALRDMLRLEHASTVGSGLSPHRKIGDTPGCEVCALLDAPSPQAADGP